MISYRTKTPGRTQRATPAIKSQPQKPAKTPAKPAKSTSPDTREQRKPSHHSLSRSPSPDKPSQSLAEVRKPTRRNHSPEKPSSPHQPERKQATRGNRSLSPAEQASPGPSKRQRGGRPARSPSPTPKVQYFS